MGSIFSTREWRDGPRESIDECLGTEYNFANRNLIEPRSMAFFWGGGGWNWVLYCTFVSKILI